MTKIYKDVFDALADTSAEALNMKIRADLMIQINQLINDKGWSQKETAKYLNVTQPRVSDLLNGKLSKFSLDMLVNMSSAIGQNIELKIVA
jgi:predicted XRE-type DNA-binding protein